jgi:hypothetical protein
MPKREEFVSHMALRRSVAALRDVTMELLRVGSVGRMVQR